MNRSPFTGDGVLNFKLHVDRHGARVDARRVRLLAVLRLAGRGRRGGRPLLAVVPRRGGGGRRAGRRLVLPALVHLLHVLLQLVQTLAEELVGILVGGRKEEWLSESASPSSGSI